MVLDGMGYETKEKSWLLGGFKSGKFHMFVFSLGLSIMVYHENIMGFKKSPTMINGYLVGGFKPALCKIWVSWDDEIHKNAYNIYIYI